MKSHELSFLLCFQTTTAAVNHVRNRKAAGLRMGPVMAVSTPRSKAINQGSRLRTMSEA